MLKHRAIISLTITAITTASLEFTAFAAKPKKQIPEMKTDKNGHHIAFQSKFSSLQSFN